MNKNKITFYSLALLSVLMVVASCKTQKPVNADNAIAVYMDQQKEEIVKTFPNAQVTVLDDSIKVLFKDGILFDVDSAVLRPDVIKNFTEFSHILKKYDKTFILINGYTDNQGSDKYNFDLSTRRAKAAYDLFSADSISSNRLYYFGMGKRYPIATNATPEGRALNRRIEIVILYNKS